MTACAIALATASAAYGIGFIDSPSPRCYRIKGDDCAISWYYASVSADPNYMIMLRVVIDGNVVFHTSGFFQTSMYLPDEAFRDHIRVKCGKPGTTPDPEPTPSLLYGNSYSWKMEARDSANLKSANYGTVYCPPKGK